MQAIHTEYVEEMNTYVNIDDMNRHDVRRGTKDTTRHQTSQHTGSESKKIRSLRSVVVCLVVLCVLLLTAVIVLCVLIYTNDNNITQQRDELQIKYENLATENEGLSTNNNNLNKQKDQLTQQINGMLETLKPDGWVYNQSSFYFISSEKKNWSESRRYCRKRGADLIIINNKEEQEFVRKISDSESIWSLWIGVFYSDVEGKWKWVDNSTLTYSFWASGEPYDQTNNRCVMSHVAQWYTYPYHSAFQWICERKLF